MKKHLINFLKVAIMATCLYLGWITGDGFKDTWIEIIKSMGANVITSKDVFGAFILPMVALGCFGWFICKLIDND